MNIIRLRLGNFRGVTKADIHFAPVGITVVEGPNEVGKSSLAEAVRVLFDSLDGSTHRDIKAIKPVNRDAGAEVELEAESGPYTFTYFKRFHRSPETTLRVSRPSPENLTGRPAHERARAILEETIDTDLWWALNLEQGQELGQADLKNKSSLATALDKAAGGHIDPEAEQSLFEAVQREFLGYYTNTGRDGQELRQSRTVVDEAHAEASSLAEKLRGLEQDIERTARLQDELIQLAAREAGLGEEAARHEKSLRAIEQCRTALEAARLELDSEKKSEVAARLAQESRLTLIQRVKTAQQGHAELENAAASFQPALAREEAALDKVETAHHTAEARCKQAEALLTLRRADFDYFNNKLHLEQLTERKARIDQVRENAASAEALLQRNPMDGEWLKAIQEAARAVDIARAKQEAGSPSVRLKALAELSIQLDGQCENLHKDERKFVSVPDRLTVTIPDLLDLEVAAGAGAEELSREMETARQTLTRLCTDAGITGPEQAGKAFEERRKALEALQNRDRIERENLRDLDYEQLAGKFLVLEKQIPAYPGERVPEPPLCPDLESAKQTLDMAEKSLRHARREWETARTALDAANRARDTRQKAVQEACLQMKVKEAELRRSEEELGRVRAEVPDEALATALDSAIRKVGQLEARAQEAEATLQNKGAEKIGNLLKTAQGSLHTLQNKQSETEKELYGLQGRLTLLGEEGLHEKHQASLSRLDHVERDDKALERRARAAKLLFETMREERDRTRRAYVAPLRDQVERLGHLLFNESFAVEVNDNLAMVNRTLDGTTVSFDSLSGGAREQLSLISRLACAMIVGRDGSGAPLILDDALGYTDPERLKLMGAVLSLAGRSCQIIILTCQPDRYSHVGEVKTVRLDC